MMLMIFLVSPSISATSPAVTQRDREDVLDVVVVHLLGGTLVDRHQHLPAVAHFRHAPFGRARRLVLQEARHDVDLLPRSVRPEVPQFGMPAGEPKLISAFR
jgi:hypothetical protein